MDSAVENGYIVRAGNVYAISIGTAGWGCDVQSGCSHTNAVYECEMKFLAISDPQVTDPNVFAILKDNCLQPPIMLKKASSLVAENHA